MRLRKPVLGCNAAVWRQQTKQARKICHALPCISLTTRRVAASPNSRQLTAEKYRRTLMRLEAENKAAKESKSPFAA